MKELAVIAESSVTGSFSERDIKCVGREDWQLKAGLNTRERLIFAEIKQQ